VPFVLVLGRGRMFVLIRGLRFEELTHPNGTRQAKRGVGQLALGPVPDLSRSVGDRPTPVSATSAASTASAIAAGSRSVLTRIPQSRLA
jgi:hypothetical protein